MVPLKVEELAEFQIAPGISARAISTQVLTVLHVRIAAGSQLPEHFHHNEQVLNLIDGELELNVDGETHALGPGTSFVLSPNVPHSARALSDCRVIDVFHPAREDFRGTGFRGYGDGEGT